MASTNKTTNYELSQFIETDRPAWLTDYNGDMRTIDSTMKAVSDVASGASGSISELADRVSTAEGNITTNTNDIAALDARADALEARVQSQAGTITNIQTEQTAQNLGIEAATELGYNLARPYDSASTYAVGDYALFQNTLYKCITAVPVGEVFAPAKWLAIKVMDEVGGGTSDSWNETTDFIDRIDARSYDGSETYTTSVLNQYARYNTKQFYFYVRMQTIFSSAKPTGAFILNYIQHKIQDLLNYELIHSPYLLTCAGGSSGNDKWYTTGNCYLSTNTSGNLATVVSYLMNSVNGSMSCVNEISGLVDLKPRA